MSAELMRWPRRRVAGGGFYGLNKRENAAAGGGGDDGGSGVLIMTVAGDQGFSASGRLRATRGLASPGQPAPAGWISGDKLEAGEKGACREEGNGHGFAVAVVVRPAHGCFVV